MSSLSSLSNSMIVPMLDNSSPPRRIKAIVPIAGLVRFQDQETKEFLRNMSQIRDVALGEQHKVAAFLRTCRTQVSLNKVVLSH